MRVLTPSPSLVTPGRIALRFRQSLSPGADLEAQFQPVKEPSYPPVIEIVDEALHAYSFAPASEPKLTNPA